MQSNNILTFDRLKWIELDKLHLFKKSLATMRQMQFSRGNHIIIDLNKMIETLHIFFFIFSAAEIVCSFDNFLELQLGDHLQK